jgi:hypothetical protein
MKWPEVTWSTNGEHAHVVISNHPVPTRAGLDRLRPQLLTRVSPLPLGRAIPASLCGNHPS